MRNPAGGWLRADRRGGEKRGFKEAFAAEVEAEIDALVAPGAAAGRDFEAFEHATRRKALDDAARGLERRLNADHTDYGGPTVACACGRAHSRFPGHALTPTGVMAIRCKQFHLPDL